MERSSIASKRCLERRHFAVETTSTFWIAEEYHQRYWQKWRPRFASLFGLILLQWADSKVAFLPEAADVACTGVAFAIGAAFVLERVLDAEVAAG